MPRPIPETARRRATREKLVLAALDLFGRNGIDATSVEQLCEAAGFTRGAFYSNFETKDDVCEAVARYMAEESIEACRVTLSEATPRAPLGSLVTRLFEATAFGPDRRQTMVEMQLRAAREPALAERLAKAREDMWPPLIEVVEWATVQADCTFSVEVHDLLRLCEALYFSPLLAHDGANLRLMAATIEALAVPNHPAAGRV
ncbi:transcriptional regulator, TetR family [Tessaracoccus bendigoensis DSM 12906]|uniref:Transcriptional regulator, TetR family n=1 Tax=Tessaracoccus bendigoensis DSM 12906 TaxID=1123357 RepID=A0A1M6B6A7_9ACTN|nr:TetR/AcrR family transcriptional regulator [Tessaracoccus bendigoensis]SHI44187.1 transcriptional regulator, TetR family [Tessaracoccus bendigoensis DSM 12906]